MDSIWEEIIVLERSALNRWIAFDPHGYLDLFTSEITYSDPTTEKRVDGLEAMMSRLAPIKSMKGMVKDPRGASRLPLAPTAFMPNVL